MGRNPRAAIEAYEAALRVRTEEDHPADWAATQNNLGNAYARLPAGDRGENLRAAIEAYEAALTVYTEEGWPERHAGVTDRLEGARAELARPRRRPGDAPRNGDA